MNRKHCSMTTEKRTYPFAHTSDPMQVNIWLEHKIQVGYSENADSELHCFISPPVGRRVGREKSTAGFQNKVDAKKPDSRKNPFYRNTNTKPNKVGLCWRGEARERADGDSCIKNRGRKADFATTMELLARFPQGTKPLRGCRELAVTACGSLRFLSKRASRVRSPVRELPEKQKAPSFLRS